MPYLAIGLMAGDEGAAGPLQFTRGDGAVARRTQDAHTGFRGLVDLLWGGGHTDAEPAVLQQLKQRQLKGHIIGEAQGISHLHPQIPPINFCTTDRWLPSELHQNPCQYQAEADQAMIDERWVRLLPS